MMIDTKILSKVYVLQIASLSSDIHAFCRAKANCVKLRVSNKMYNVSRACAYFSVFLLSLEGIQDTRCRNKKYCKPDNFFFTTSRVQSGNRPDSPRCFDNRLFLEKPWCRIALGDRRMLALSRVKSREEKNEGELWVIIYNSQLLVILSLQKSRRKRQEGK